MAPERRPRRPSRGRRRHDGPRPYRNLAMLFNGGAHIGFADNTGRMGGLALAAALWDRRSLFVVCRHRGARQTTKSDGLSHRGRVQELLHHLGHDVGHCARLRFQIGSPHRDAARRQIALHRGAHRGTVGRRRLAPVVERHFERLFRLTRDVCQAFDVDQVERADIVRRDVPGGGPAP